jgi:two-component system NtrC family sensor kinase
MHNRDKTRIKDKQRIEDFQTFSNRILTLANRGAPRIEFQRGVSKYLLSFSRCDVVELRMTDGDLHYRWVTESGRRVSFRFEIVRFAQDEHGVIMPCIECDDPFERLCVQLFDDRYPVSGLDLTSGGSFFTGNTSKPLAVLLPNGETLEVQIGGKYRSLAVITFEVDEVNPGLLIFGSRKRDFFSLEDVELYEGVAQTLGVAVTNRRAQAALRERVKELTCLYGIAQVANRVDLSLEGVMQEIVEVLPPAMQYPGIATARIFLDGHAYDSFDYEESQHKLTADVVVNSQRRGVVEVAYCGEGPELETGLFLKEEQRMLDTVAGQVALIVERRQTEDEKRGLEEQLRHADRLATVGQLAAGVAHELNEPLGNILGFAQLASKSENLPSQVGGDIEKIIDATLHGREVVKKLLIFARQMPTRKSRVELNKIVEDGLYFFESRCAKAGIEIERSLSTGLPQITVDPAQLNQVLVNLVVNALHAMPEGGKLTIRTCSDGDGVALVVEDTGAGMTEDVLKQVFIPFFTTKEVGQGTGLGLPVVHGIVTQHGGTIEVESEPEHGSRFTVRLPIGSVTRDEEYDTDAIS